MRDTNQEQKNVEYSQEAPAAADRLTSRKAARILECMVAKGDDYFLPSRAEVIIPFDSPRWKRPSLELQYTVHQLQQISKKVRSGLKPAEAGLTKPGKIVVEQ